MTELKFNKKKHKYTVDGKELQSVTTWCKQFFEPFDAKAIARMLASFPANKAKKRGVKYWLKQWKQAGEDGTRVHKEIEDFILFKTKTVSGKAAKAIEFFLDVLVTFDAKPEVKVHDDALGLAGTIDLVLANGKELTLVDWKTNKEFKKSSPRSLVDFIPHGHVSQYTLQLSMYAYILERQGYKIKQLLLVHLKDDGSESINITYDKELVERCLEYVKNKL